MLSLFKLLHEKNNIKAINIHLRSLFELCFFSYRNLNKLGLRCQSYLNSEVCKYRRIRTKDRLLSHCWLSLSTLESLRVLSLANELSCVFQLEKTAMAALATLRGFPPATRSTGRSSRRPSWSAHRSPIRLPKL